MRYQVFSANEWLYPDSQVEDSRIKRIELSSARRSNGPLSSMRFEAMRAGAEDYELLRILAKKDKALADEITASCLTSFNEVNEDPMHFEKAHRELLQAVSEL